MSYKGHEPSGTVFPRVVIILAMAVLVGTLVSIRRPVENVRVWVPAQSPGSATVRSRTNCSPVWAGCDPVDKI